MAGNLPAQNFGIPNLITPGGKKVYPLKSLNKMQSLMDAMLANPAQLGPAVYDCLAMYDRMDSYKPIVTTLLSAMSGEDNAGTGDNIYDGHFMGNRPQDGIEVDNYYFWCPIRTPKNLIFKVLVAPTGVNIGRNDAEFSFVITKGALSPDDILGYGPHFSNKQLKVLRVEPAGDGQRVVVRQLKGVRNQDALVAYLQVGFELDRLYNIKPEASETGSTGNLFFNRSMKGALTTSRWLVGVTGHADRIALSKQYGPGNYDPHTNGTVYHYHEPDGKTTDYFLTLAENITLRMMFQENDQHMFFGKADRSVDGSPARDPQGREVISGDGILEQCNKRANISYNKIDTNFFDNLIGRSIDKNNGTFVDMLLIGGHKLRDGFGKYCASQFKYNPMPLYYDLGKRKLVTEEMGPISAQAIRTGFVQIQLQNGRVTLSENSYFDQNNIRRVYRTDGSGDTENSHNGVAIDLSRIPGIERNKSCRPITPVYLKGCGLVRGTVQGMSKGGILSTAVDMRAVHYLHTQGVAVHDTNALTQIIKV